MGQTHVYLVALTLVLAVPCSLGNAQDTSNTQAWYRKYLEYLNHLWGNINISMHADIETLAKGMASECQNKMLHCTNMGDSCSLEIKVYNSELEIRISNQKYVFEYYSSESQEDMTCMDVEQTIDAPDPPQPPCLCNLPTTGIRSTTITTELGDENIVRSLNYNDECGQDDSQASPLPIVGFLALGFVAGIAVTSVVFCIVLRKRLSKASSGAALRTDFQTKSDNMESRNSQAGNSVIYNELDEPKQISHVLPIKRENVSAAQNYEAPCVPKSDQHVYSPIQTDFSATSSEVTTTHGEKNIEDGNVDHVYNHLHEYRDANNSRDSAGDYDHLQDGGGRSRQNFFRERTQIGGREKQNTNKPKESADDNYFALSKQEESCSEKTVDNDGSNSDNYFTLSKQDLSGAEKSADNNGSNSDNYFTLSKQAISGAEKSADIEGSNSDNYFTLSKQDLSGAGKSADNDGSNPDNYFTLSKQDLSGAEKSADIEGSNSDNYFTLSKQDLSGTEKSADNNGSNSDNYFTLSKQDLSGAGKSADNDGSNSDN